MIKTIKRLSGQEWAILIVFVLALLFFIASVQWQTTSEKEDTTSERPAVSIIGQEEFVSSWTSV